MAIESSHRSAPQPEYSPPITKLIKAAPAIQGILFAHPQVETTLEKYYQTKEQLGPLGALDIVLRPELREQPLEPKPIDDLRQKVTILKAVVQTELTDLEGQPDSPLKATLQQRGNLYDVTVERYIQDHQPDGTKLRVKRHPDMSGNRFKDKLPRKR